MALKFKAPFGPGRSKANEFGRKLRNFEERKRRERLKKLKGKPRKKIGKRT